MIRAKDVISPVKTLMGVSPEREVPSAMPLTDVLPILLDAPGRVLGVSEGDKRLGIIDEISLLEGIGRQISARDDSSYITLECRPEEYSASRIAHAVEDSDAHLVDLWTDPGIDNQMTVTLRVRRNDPTATIHSLERYGFNVVDASGENYKDAEVALVRLLEINKLLNV